MALGWPFDLLPYSLLLLRYCQCWNGCSSDLFTCWDDGQKCCVLISFHAASHCKVVVNIYIYILYIYIFVFVFVVVVVIIVVVLLLLLVVVVAVAVAGAVVVVVAVVVVDNDEDVGCHIVAEYSRDTHHARHRDTITLRVQY
jgi:hypothetical protein